jgi:hypothetical protein
MFLHLFGILAFVRFIGKFFGFAFLGTVIGLVFSGVNYHLLVFVRHVVNFFRRMLNLSERGRVLDFDHHFFGDFVCVSRRNGKLFLISPLQVTFDCLFLRVLDVFVLL